MVLLLKDDIVSVAFLDRIAVHDVHDSCVVGIVGMGDGGTGAMLVIHGDSAATEPTLVGRRIRPHDSPASPCSHSGMSA